MSDKSPARKRANAVSKPAVIDEAPFVTLDDILAHVPDDKEKEKMQKAYKKAEKIKKKEIEKELEKMEKMKSVIKKSTKSVV